MFHINYSCFIHFQFRKNIGNLNSSSYPTLLYVEIYVWDVILMLIFYQSIVPFLIYVKVKFWKAMELLNYRKIMLQKIISHFFVMVFLQHPKIWNENPITKSRPSTNLIGFITSSKYADKRGHVWSCDVTES